MTAMLPKPDLLVECAQGFVEGWTASSVHAYAAEQVAVTDQEIAKLKALHLRLVTLEEAVTAVVARHGGVRAENNKNRPAVKNKTSKYRGVSKRGSKWQVVVRVNGVIKWLGSFAKQEDAAIVAAPYFAGIAE